MRKLFCLFFVLLCACSDVPDVPYDPVYYDTYLDITVLDKDNNDLLNPNSTSSQAINTDIIQVFFVKNGKEELFFNSRLDASTGFLLLSPEENGSQIYITRFFLNDFTTGKNRTIIEWKPGLRDTIDAEIKKDKNYTYIDKLWFNKAEVWNKEGNDDRSIVMRK